MTTQTQTPMTTQTQTPMTTQTQTPTQRLYAKDALTWTDLFTMMSQDSGGRWYALPGTPAEAYIRANGYRSPSRAYPHSHAKVLLTKKFAKWLAAKHPETAAKYHLKGV